MSPQPRSAAAFLNRRRAADPALDKGTGPAARVFQRRVGRCATPSRVAGTRGRRRPGVPAFCAWMDAREFWVTHGEALDDVDVLRASAVEGVVGPAMVEESVPA